MRLCVDDDSDEGDDGAACGRCGVDDNSDAVDDGAAYMRLSVGCGCRWCSARNAAQMTI